ISAHIPEEMWEGTPQSGAAVYDLTPIPRSRRIRCPPHDAIYRGSGGVMKPPPPIGSSSSVELAGGVEGAAAEGGGAAGLAFEGGLTPATRSRHTACARRPSVMPLVCMH